MVACTTLVMKTRTLTDLIGYLHVRVHQYRKTVTGTLSRLVLCKL